MICDSHKHKPENLELLEKYKQKCILSGDHASFSKDISIFHIHDPEVYKTQNGARSEDIKDVAVFLLQTIRVEGVNLNLFYDNGCSDMCITKRAVDLLENLGRAVNLT